MISTEAKHSTNGAARAKVTPPPSPWGRGSGIITRAAIHGVEQADAVAVEQIDWLWYTFFARGAHGLCAGRIAEGKTTLVAGVAVAAAAPPDAPVSLLGREVTPVAEGQFVFVVLDENSRKSAVEQVDRWIAVLGLDRAYVWSRIVLLARSGTRARKLKADDKRNPGNGDTWAAIVHAAIHEKVIGLLIIDSMARVFGGDANNEANQAEIGEVVTELTEKGGVTVIIIVHVRKASGEITLDDIAGHHQRAALADSIIAVEGTKENGRTIASRVRQLKQREINEEWAEPRSFAFKRDELGAWKLEEADAKPAAAITDRVVEALRGHPDGMTSRQIRNTCGISGERIGEVIKALFLSKKITRKTKRVRGREVETFILDPRGMSWAEVMGAEEQKL